eukprot:2082-Heterococcus_DN1.PRE.2
MICTTANTATTRTSATAQAHSVQPLLQLSPLTATFRVHSTLACDDATGVQTAIAANSQEGACRVEVDAVNRVHQCLLTSWSLSVALECKGLLTLGRRRPELPLRPWQLPKVREDADAPGLVFQSALHAALQRAAAAKVVGADLPVCCGHYHKGALHVHAVALVWQLDAVSRGALPGVPKFHSLVPAGAGHQPHLRDVAHCAHRLVVLADDSACQASRRAMRRIQKSCYKTNSPSFSCCFFFCVTSDSNAVLAKESYTLVRQASKSGGAQMWHTSTSATLSYRKDRGSNHSRMVKRSVVVASAISALAAVQP